MFPPINASWTTFNDPSKSTSSFNTIKLEALSKFKSPLVDDKVLPVSLKFPVSTLDPFIKVVLDPSVNVAPSVRFILSSFAEKFTVPVSCSTWNKFPTLKSPLWSTLLNLIFASLDYHFITGNTTRIVCCFFSCAYKLNYYSYTGTWDRRD